MGAVPASRRCYQSVLILQEARDDILGDVEARCLQAVDRSPKVEQVECGSFLENAQSSKNRDAACPSLDSPLPVVDDQLISPKFCRKQDCVTFAPIQPGKRRVWKARGSVNFKPSWRLTHPVPNCFRSGGAQKLFANHTRHHNSAIHFNEDFDFFDENQIIDRGCVGNDDHPGWGLRAASSACCFRREFSAVSLSCSKSETS